jgi:purine-nucleoside/S-methyl-5'-thioadenosine phosphorylase / adenosine deaminase
LYAARVSHGPVALAFTDRHGGVSDAPYDSLDLAWAGGDDPEALAQNRRLLMRDFAPDADPVADLAYLQQVHGADVVVVGARRLDGWIPPRADALVTAEPGIALMVRAADCVPVLLADDVGSVVGAAHCGRPGLVAGVVPATVATMRDLGAGGLTAWIGPYVCGRCYEVPQQMQDDVTLVEPESRATTSWGTPSVDVGAGVRAQLERNGVAVVDLSTCTRESADLFSYRRDGKASGRQAGLVRITP